MAFYDSYVKEERYVNDTSFTHYEKTYHELNGCTWGIVGLGAIGKRVAMLAKLFGCKVQYYSTTGAHHDPDVDEVDFDTLLSTSDIVSLHCPLTEATEGLIDADALAKMKSSAVLLNLARGPVVEESALADALENGTIAGAGLDVLAIEPMSEDNPLRRIKDSDKLMITPHIAWAGKETRIRLMDTIFDQIQEFTK